MLGFMVVSWLQQTREVLETQYNTVLDSGRGLLLAEVVVSQVNVTGFAK